MEEIQAITVMSDSKVVKEKMYLVFILESRLAYTLVLTDADTGGMRVGDRIPLSLSGGGGDSSP